MCRFPFWLNLGFGVLAVTVVLAWLPIFWKVFYFGVLKVRGPERNPGAAGAPRPETWARALVAFLANPWRSYHAPHNPLWVQGAVCYHAGILLIVAGYVLSLAVLGARLYLHQAVPDLALGVPTPSSHLPVNLLALVFGNAEKIPSRFLFGSWAPAFVAVSWVELACAVYGNAFLLASLFRRGQGAVAAPRDPILGNLRIPGRFSREHALVRSVIFLIILFELLSRLEWTPFFVYGHTVLGLVFLCLLPNTYLRHIFYMPLALRLAVRKRRAAVVA
jgi:nitrate reductase gamma subunit